MSSYCIKVRSHYTTPLYNYLKYILIIIEEAMFRLFLCKAAKEGPINYFCETGLEKLNPALNAFGLSSLISGFRIKSKKDV